MKNKFTNVYFLAIIKHDATITLKKLNWAAFLLRHIWFIDFHNQNDSSKLNSIFKIPRSGSITIMVRRSVL